jgi:hypothetical protein
MLARLKKARSRAPASDKHAEDYCANNCLLEHESLAKDRQAASGSVGLLAVAKDGLRTAAGDRPDGRPTTSFLCLSFRRDRQEPPLRICRSFIRGGDSANPDGEVPAWQDCRRPPRDQGRVGGDC